MRSNHTIPFVNRKEPFILGLGDLALMVFSLWAALVLRYGGLPSGELWQAHLFPFAIVFVISLISFYTSGLYGRTIHLSRATLPGLIIRAQIANGIIAVILFYLIPNFSVTPKTNLFVYILLSTAFVILWRLNTYPLLSLRRKYPALVIGAGPEVDELVSEMSHNPRVGLYCREKVSPDAPADTLTQSLSATNGEFQYIVADIDDARVEAMLPALYQGYFAKVRVIDLHELYEEIFDRIPLSRMNHVWIMSAISSISPGTYDAGKRVIDIFFGALIGLAALVAWPFVAMAVKLEDGGPVMIPFDRIGMNGKPIRILKFRSMTESRSDSDKWVVEGTNRVTKVGKFIRQTRIDELPQALAILRGDMSLIGPRADNAGLAARLEKEIPYYAIRTVIAPGLSGWAQINQEKPPQSVEETRERLSYDLFYITHRSLGLDLRIALRTVKTLLSHVGM